MKKNQIEFKQSSTYPFKIVYILLLQSINKHCKVNEYYILVVNIFVECIDKAVVENENTSVK